jgi:hypothetical protein
MINLKHSYYLENQKEYLNKFEEILKLETKMLFGNRFFNQKKEFIRTFRYSFFLRLFAFFEKYIMFYCDYLQKRENYKLSLGDLQEHSFLKKFRKYMLKVADLKDPSLNKDWNYLLIFARIRNIIIHSDGFLNTDVNNKELMNFIKNEKLVSIDSKNQIYLLKKYNYFVVSKVNNFVMRYNYL